MSLLKNIAALAAATGLVYAGLQFARKKLDDSLLAEQDAGANARAQDEDAADAAPTEGTAAPADGAPPKAPAATQEDRPNTNPVDSAPAAPVTDPTKIASPEDFQAWDEVGCQG